MSENKKKVPEEGPNGVDRWTSNGYGISVNGKKAEPPAQKEDIDHKEPMIDEIEEA